MNLFVVIKKYCPDPNLFVEIPNNEEVEIIKEYKSENWKDWLECLYDNKVCYVPKQYLEIRGNKATLVRSYNSSELNGRVGILIDVEFTLNGFVFGRMLNGNRKGWIPQEVLIEQPVPTNWVAF